MAIKKLKIYTALKNSFNTAGFKLHKESVIVEKDVIVKNERYSVFETEQNLSFKGINTSQSGLDYNFDTIIPLVENDINRSKSDIKNSYVAIDSFYNYYAKDYEESVNLYDEKDIPNIYACSTNGHNSPIKKSHRSFSNVKVNKAIFKKIKFLNNSIIPEISISNKYTNVILNRSQVSSPEIKKLSKDFPFGIKVKYSSQPKETKLGDFLTKNGIYEEFINSYVNTIKGKTKYSHVLDPIHERYEMNVNGFINLKMSNLLFPSFGLFRHGRYSLLFKEKINKRTSYSDMLVTLLLKSFINQLIIDKHRTYKDLLANIESYSEVLFYKVEKFHGTTLTNPIQTYYIPNVENSFTLIDTQVKANKVYNYVVSECKLTISNRYAVNAVSETEKDTFIDVENTMEAIIFEIPVYKTKKATGIAPPPSPQIQFKPSQNSKKTINITLSPNKGRYYVEDNFYDNPLPYENNLKQALRKSDGTMKYEYYGGPINYELYRVDIRPKDVMSFAQNRRYLFDSVGIVRNVTFEDPVSPNKKYYYMARAISPNNLKSYPSTIYEVELVQNQEDAIIQCEVWKPRIEKQYERSMNMRRLLQIIPSGQQTLLSDESGAIMRSKGSYKNSLDDANLGIVDEKVWGRKFKIRITSNETGKKIDLNVLFNIKKNKTNQEPL